MGTCRQDWAAKHTGGWVRGGGGASEVGVGHSLAAALPAQLNGTQGGVVGDERVDGGGGEVGKGGWAEALDATRPPWEGGGGGRAERRWMKWRV